jgi:hypothetical protein
MDDVGMNLAQRDERPELGVRLSRGVARNFARFFASAEFVQKDSAVTLDCGFGIVFGKSEIKGLFPVCARESTLARRESVHQPGKFAQVVGVENAQFAFLRRAGRHWTMLPESTLYELSAHFRRARDCPPSAHR